MSEHQDIDYREPDIETLNNFEPSPEAVEEVIPEASKPINYEKFRRKSQSQITEHWDLGLPIGLNLVNLINRCVALPNPDSQSPLVASYFLIPSAMAQVVPILLLFGKAGCGKSTLSEIASAIHKTPLISANTTAVALRNKLNKQRWVDPENCWWEKNTCLVFDNVNRDTLSNEYLYGMFLSGYDRNTDSIEISKGQGENYLFRVFSPKVVSAIHPIWSFPKFEELDRRLLIIRCKKINEMTEEEIENSFFKGDESLSKKLKLKSSSLGFLAEEFNKFWQEESNLEKYVEIGQLLEKLPINCSPENQVISIDLLTTGIITGVWNSVSEAIASIETYWQNINVWKQGYSSSFDIVLRQLIEQETRAIREVNERYNAGLPLEIDPEKVKAEITQAQNRGMLDANPNPQLINDAMLALGWRLERNAKKQIKWMKIQ